MAGVAACAEEEAPTQANCQAEGFSSDATTESFCGCQSAYLRCRGAGVVATRADCICVAEETTCPADAEGLVFCSGKAGYQCKAGTMTSVLECPGSASCIEETSKEKLRCGTTSSYIDYAREGEPCISEQSAACSFDQSKVLNCQRGSWVSARTCGGGTSRCERVFQGDPGVNCAGGSASCVGCGSF